MIRTSINELLSQENLNTIKGLELLARSTIAGLYNGVHRSKRTGTGQEFSHYRSYQPGDDLRHLDWKLFARSDRFYIRQSDIETHVTVRFIVDTSASMLHKDSGISKIQFCRYIAATLGWLSCEQHDELGLYAINNQQLHEYRPRRKGLVFHQFLHQLLAVEPKGQFPSGLDINNSFQLKPKRELIIFLTDMHENHQELLGVLQQLRNTGNEVLLFHLMAADELDLPYTGILTFKDLETGKTVQVAGKKIRADYQKKVKTHLEEIRQKMLDMNISYNFMRMDQPVGLALQAFLEHRRRM